MKSLKVFIITVLVLNICGCYLASPGIKSHPGFADVSYPSGRNVDTDFKLTLGSWGLKPLKWVIQQDLAEKRLQAQDQVDEIDVEIQPLNSNDSDLMPSNGTFISPERISEQMMAHLLDGVEALRIAVYKVNGQSKIYAQNIASSKAQLRDQGWKTLVSVNDGKEQVLILGKPDSDLLEQDGTKSLLDVQAFHGVQIIIVNEQEAMYVNIIGHIDAAEII